MNDELLEAVELEVRIAAAKSVREHMQAAGEEKSPDEKKPEEVQALDSLTDALITLRTQQIEKMWDQPKADE